MGRGRGVIRSPNRLKSTGPEPLRRSNRSRDLLVALGMMLAMLGMAVGTGNIWRFPRVTAANGGGSFLVAWAVFLLAWSVPLLLVEFAMGKAMRRGTIGSFTGLLGERFAWMDAWKALCIRRFPDRDNPSDRAGSPTPRGRSG